MSPPRQIIPAPPNLRSLSCNAAHEHARRAAELDPGRVVLARLRLRPVSVLRQALLDHPRTDGPSDLGRSKKSRNQPVRNLICQAEFRSSGLLARHSLRTGPVLEAGLARSLPHLRSMGPTVLAGSKEPVRSLELCSVVCRRQTTQQAEGLPNSILENLICQPEFRSSGLLVCSVCP